MEGVVDTLKTTGIGFGGFWVSLMEWLPDLVSLGVGILTIIYLIVKIKNEVRKSK
jgi:hypothetical protein